MVGPAMRVDAHTHVFCWGENPRDGFLSGKTRGAWTTRLLLFLTGLARRPGATLSDKLRNLLVSQIEASGLDRVVVLAQDAVYRPDGSRDDSGTHFYVSNDYVLSVATESRKIVPGVSINPRRPDALRELERCRDAGARLVKVHTAIQGVDPCLPRFDPFYRLAAGLDMVLMFHTGYEHSCSVVSQAFTDPARLARALDHGAPVIAAHSGTCAFFDPVDYFPSFVRMARRYPNLLGDTAILSTAPRAAALARMARSPSWLKARLVHGSDYPFPPSRIWSVLRAGLRPRGAANPLDLDLRIKERCRFGPDYPRRIWPLLTR